MSALSVKVFTALASKQLSGSTCAVYSRSFPLQRPDDTGTRFSQLWLHFAGIFCTLRGNEPVLLEGVQGSPNSVRDVYRVL